MFDGGGGDDLARIATPSFAGVCIFLCADCRGICGDSCASLGAMQWFGCFRGKSGHCGNTRNRSRLTQSNRLLRNCGAMQHGQHTAISTYKCSHYDYADEMSPSEKLSNLKYKQHCDRRKSEAVTRAPRRRSLDDSWRTNGSRVIRKLLGPRVGQASNPKNRSRCLKRCTSLLATER